jgi:hypothetical protein
VAVTASGLYVANFIDVFDASQLAINLISTSDNRIALLSDSATPNFDTDASWSSTNEVTGTGWASGGILFSAAAAGGTSVAPTLTVSPTGTMMWDMNDVAVSATTITNAKAARLYADALTTPVADALICLINFGANFSTNNGVFGIQFAGTGVVAMDLTP